MKTLALLCALAFLVSACELLRDRPFCLDSWTPGPAYSGDGSDAALSFVFSNDCDRPNVESALSVSEDGTALRGAFEWEGRVLRFKPYAPLRPNRTYRFRIDASARDADGQSLGAEASGSFSTRSAGEGARLLAFEPGDGALLSRPADRLSLLFSAPVDAVSCARFFVLSPKLRGVWSVETAADAADKAGSCRAVFSPLEEWAAGAAYVLTLPADFPDAAGRPLGAEANLRFRLDAGSVPAAPAFLEVLDAAGEPKAAVAAGGAEYAAFERGDRLRLAWDAPVDLESVDAALETEGAEDARREDPALFGSSAVWRVPAPEWGKGFVLRLREGASDARGRALGAAGPWRLRFGGPSSKPPELRGVRVGLQPPGPDGSLLRSASYSLADAFSSLALAAADFPVDVPTAFAVELYWDLAPGARLDPLELMARFRMEATGNALGFAPRRVRVSDFPDPAPEAWSACARARVDGWLSNRAGSGVVSFVVDAGFEDSAGNPVGRAVRLPLLK